MRRLSQALLLAGASACSGAVCAGPQVEDTMAERVLACTGCHGREGRAAPDGYYPRIAGKPVGYLYQQLLNFRDGRRQYGLMTTLLDPLTDSYLGEIAAHFAALDLPYPAPQPGSAPPQVFAAGRELVMRGDAARGIPACALCHGAAMTGVAPSIPGLLGLPRDYINGQLGAWKNGNRRAAAPDCMAQIAERLTPQDVNALSQWLAAQKLPADAKPAAALPAPLPIACGGVS